MRRYEVLFNSAKRRFSRRVVGTQGGSHDAQRGTVGGSLWRTRYVAGWAVLCSVAALVAAIVLT